MTAAQQLKIGLRVRDLERSARLYVALGFSEIPGSAQPELRYLTFGDVWLILSDLRAHAYHNAERERATQAGPPGLGVVLTMPTADLDGAYRLWLDEGLPVTSEPFDVGWAHAFFGLDPDGYELMFEQLNEY